MEILYIVVVAGLFIWIRNSLTDEIRKIRLDLFQLRDMLERKQQEPKQEQSEQQLQHEQWQQEKPPVIFREEIKPEIKEEIIPPFIKQEPIEEPVKEEPQPVPSFVFAEEEIKAEPVYYSSIDYTAKPKEKKPSFFESHPDLEKFIGENIINKIGIAILVLGIAFFVKYAIDQNWINEIGRTSIGVLCGGLLIGVAHRLQKSFKAFSFVLIGGGLAVLYFTISISFHDYHLFSQTAAFAIMVVITAFAVILSIAYDRMELAILAIIGGFSTPFILSTGEGNYRVLFTYLLILNTGMLALAFRKQWTAITIVCYAFTVLIFGGWIVSNCLQYESPVHLTTFLFGVLFYLVFFLMSIIYNVKNNVKFRVLEIGLLLSNTFLFYSAGMALLYYGKYTAWQGLFTATLAIINFLFAFFLYKRDNIDKNLVFLLIGLVLTFISLAAPVQLEGNYITMFWAIEAVLLLWFSQKSGIELIRNTSVVVFGLMVISLIMDWLKLYGDYSTELPFAIIINKPFITGVISIAAVIVYGKLLSRETLTHFMWKNLEVSSIKFVTSILTVALIYFVFLLELNYQLIKRVNYDEGIDIALGVYNFLALAVLWLIAGRKVKGNNALIFSAAAVFFMLLYIGRYNQSITEVRNNFLINLPNAAVFFGLHFILFLLVGYAIYIYNRGIIQIENSSILSFGKWTTVLLAVYLLSCELEHIVTWISYRPDSNIYDITQQIHKAGYSVLWGCISFFLIRMGMKQKDKDIRIIALTLFSLAILKLFIFDIKGISEGGKILAFISLGILLLVVSFMYQRLKKLILADDTKQATENTTTNDENNL